MRGPRLSELPAENMRFTEPPSLIHEKSGGSDGGFMMNGMTIEDQQKMLLILQSEKFKTFIEMEKRKSLNMSNEEDLETQK